MDSKRVEHVNVSLQDDVPDYTLRTEDKFDSDEDENGWETENSDVDDDMECDRGEEFEIEMGNPGWADAMAKILTTNVPKGKNSVVLAKAKKINDVKAAKDDVGFEVDGEIKEEKPDSNLLNQVAEEIKENKISKRDWKFQGRLKPCILEKNREKTLAKIATKGVVQLFNAVRDHQQSLNKKLNQAGSIRKKERIIQSVNKQTFLDMLMGSTGTKAERKREAKEIDVELKKEDDVSWNVLRDDFMMGAKMKDWDKAPEPQPSVEDKSLNVENEEGESEYSSGDSSVEEEGGTDDSNENVE